jgi:hypothetical protein
LKYEEISSNVHLHEIVASEREKAGTMKKLRGIAEYITSWPINPPPGWLNAYTYLTNFPVTGFTSFTSSCHGGLLLPPHVRRFAMLSNQSFRPQKSPTAQWLQSLQDKLQGWIRHEIIDEDPCDEDKFTAQKLYEEFQALEQASKVNIIRTSL